jgi:signal transduction histidine kinase
MRPPRRVSLAAILIGIAVLLPTTAWYISGSRDACRRAAALTAGAENELRNEIEREAQRLGTRLDDLRRQESNRPFFHYQTLYRDPKGAAQGLAVTPSPLVSGTTDPLIWAHFQIDEIGLVTLPTVSERFPELSSDADFVAFCALLTELQNAVMMDEKIGSDTDDERVLILTDREWQQIRSAETVYATITGRMDPAAPGDDAKGGEPGRVAIRVRPLTWHTMVLGSGPALAALREVHTPSGILIQGFAIASRVVRERLDESSLAPRFSPAPSAATEAANSLVADTGWILEADLETALRPARAEGRAIIHAFRINFAVTSSAILLAAAALLWIVFQTDRLARQRARFAAAAAHELRTPLSGLLLHSEMLAQNLGDPEQRSRYAETVSSEAERLGRVVGNMLDLSRLERGAVLAHPVPGDLGTAVATCIEHSRAHLEDLGVSVSTDIQPGLPPAIFDNDALRQILDNLLDNAEKHTRTAEPRRIEVRVAAKGGFGTVEVRDNGPGVPRHARRTLFRPFARLREAQNIPGLGLGLALARSLARAQGGDLDLDLEGGPGAAFILTVPMAPADMPAARFGRRVPGYNP